MIFLKKEISDVAKGILFQNNVPATWDSFKGRAEPILSLLRTDLIIRLQIGSG